MYGIYKYECGLKFLDIVGETEDVCWKYLELKIGKKVNKDAFEIRPIHKVTEEEINFYKTFKREGK